MIAAHIAPHTAKTTIDTPWGPALIARSPAGLTGLWFEGQKDHPGALDGVKEDRSDPLLQQCRTQVQEYAAGRRTEFDLPLDLHGTAFQQAVWQALLAIPHGELSTYGEIAEILNQPQASRAVGAAVGLNPISIIVPCHRVVGSNASLTGYAGGLHRKVALLQLEGLTIRGQRVHPTMDTASLF
ncbi:MAG TPA: methylated-DNA--[protein]-cysteine S-methyltransferase [Aquabacterium sp.]|nr:methylated-DNA--[protein]-cysteine S-methyltransferase [Aquabacterium sp.]